MSVPDRPKVYHPELEYRGGQRQIIHLQADLAKAVHWADANGARWAFSDRNAGARLAEFFRRWQDLDKVNWSAVAANDFRDMQVKEGKQAEFLMFGAFPWSLVESIGVIDQSISQHVQSKLSANAHQPPVYVQRGWYY